MKNKAEEYALSTISDNVLIHFWPYKDAAEENITAEWQLYTACELSMDNLIEDVLPEIEKKAYLCGVYATDGKTGFVVTLQEFSRDLFEELEKY